MHGTIRPLALGPSRSTQVQVHAYKLQSNNIKN